MEKVLRWGFVGAGRISHDYAQCLQTHLNASGHEIVAVADIDFKRANEFAKQFEIPKVYGSVEEIATDPSVDLAYVATLNHQHFTCVKILLEAGKHVLCEKPMSTLVGHTRELVELARSKKRFLLEGIGSRFTPAYRHVRNLLEENVIGEPNFVQVCLGQDLRDNQRIVDKQFGGSVTLDLGVYATHLAVLAFKGAKPNKISATGYVNETGADEVATITLEFDSNKFANIVLSGNCQLFNSGVVAGPKGYIRILPRIEYPTTIESPKGTVTYPYPDIGEIYYKTSPALVYEPEEVKRCIEKGLIETPYLTHEESMLIAEIATEIHKQLGIKFDP